MNMVEKLRLIADAIDQGKGIELIRDGCAWENKVFPDSDGDVFIFHDYEYRIKPDKPRSGVVRLDTRVPMAYEAVELTEEVRAALESAGIEI